MSVKPKSQTKQHIIDILSRQKGQYLSGAVIADMLSVSRNAVWKAVKELQNDGCDIVSAVNRGYALLSDYELLSAEGIRKYLECPERVAAIEVYDALPSTNRAAKALAVADAPHGTVVVANAQTEGRGRHGRTFFSPAESGLYMSVIWKPTGLGVMPPSAITAFAAVCVSEAIEAVTGKSPSIKWVNDIFWQGKKVGGILTEAVTDFESRSLQWVVLGIGLNVMMPPEGFPSELQGVAGALYGEADVPPVRNRLAAEIVNRILGCDELPTAAEIYGAYKKRLCMLGEMVSVAEGDEAYRAVAVDIDDTGRLLVCKENGDVHALLAGEIHI